VACYSTRAKEKEGLFTVKNDTDSRLLMPGLHFDFTTPGQLVSDLPYISYISSYFFLPDIPLLNQEFEALSFRGPPIA
jgi:hydroxyacyl-ACP dehydratase HTD2-like protein with hotdog domain